MIRIFDFLFALFGLFILSPVIVLILIVGYFDTGSPVFIQERVGKSKIPFRLCKFRSMHINTKSVASHLSSEDSITGFGKILRKSKFDELLQLLNVLNGDMSFVGPRPNLYNQCELIKERELRGIYKAKPGITGLAQIQKIDMSTPSLLAETDAIMISQLNVINYFKYILLTLVGNGFGDRVVKN